MGTSNAISVIVRINGKIIPEEQIARWELVRARAVLRKLTRGLGLAAIERSGPTELSSLRARIVDIKLAAGRSALRAALQGNTRLSGKISKLALFFSGERRKECVVEMQVGGIDVQRLSETLDALMLRDSTDNERANLGACPDHYLLEPRGDVLEVIETTGGSPFASQFFMRFNDESGLASRADANFTHSSVGTARLLDGTVIGGVRHQFRQNADGVAVRLMVEFPHAVPNSMIREHQMHLACEFSRWISGMAQTA